MAKLYVNGERYAFDRPALELTVPKMNVEQLLDTLNDLGVLEVAHDQGTLICTPQAWNDVVEVAKKIAFELEWRPFVKSCGIILEVR